MPLKKQGKYRFTDFEIDLARRTFTRSGHAIAISTRTFDLLAVLVLNAQRVVAKEELMRALGPDSVLEESNLGQHIFLLQKALTSTDPGEKLILRIPGQGYKLTAQVTEAPVEEPVAKMEAEFGLEDEAEPPRQFVPRFAAFGVDEAPKSSRAKRETKREAKHEPNPEPVSEFDSDSGTESKGGFFARLRPSGPLQIAVYIGIVALLFFFVWLIWNHSRHSRPERDEASLRLILAGFENTTGEPNFDQSLKTALTLDLQQSPYLSVPPESRVEEALAALKFSANQLLSSSAARQLCQRLGGQAWITANIRRLTRNYLVTVEAFECGAGTDLAQSRGIADSPDAVVAVLDKVAADLRGQLGESRASVASFSKPFFSGRPSSLEALKAYADGSAFQREGKSDDAIQLFQRAIFLDPKFALAFADLAAVQANLGHVDEANASLAKAYNLRETVDDQHRFILTGVFHDRITGDLQASLRNDKQWASLYPRNPVPLTHQADLEIQLGAPVLALDPARHALALNPDNPAAYVVLARAQMHLGQFEDAASTCQQAIQRQIETVEIHQFLLQIAFLRLDQTAIDEQMSWATGKPEEPEMQLQKALIDFAEGRASTARTIFQSVADNFRKRNQPEQATKILAKLPRIQAELGLVESADIQLSRLPETEESAEIPVAWAHIGETSRASSILKRQLAAHPSSTLWQQLWAPQVRASVAMNQHEPQAAIDALNPANQPAASSGPSATIAQTNFDLSSFDIPAMRGRAYLAAKQPVLAEAEFHKILDHSGIEPLSHNYPLAQLGLARSLAAQGKTTEAGFAYNVVLQIWKEADVDLPRLREAKAEYAKLGGQLAKLSSSGSGSPKPGGNKPRAANSSLSSARPKRK